MRRFPQPFHAYQTRSASLKPSSGLSENIFREPICIWIQTFQKIQGIFNHFTKLKQCQRQHWGFSKMVWKYFRSVFVVPTIIINTTVRSLPWHDISLQYLQRNIIFYLKREFLFSGDHSQPSTHNSDLACCLISEWHPNFSFCSRLTRVCSGEKLQQPDKRTSRFKRDLRQGTFWQWQSFSR